MNSLFIRNFFGWRTPRKLVSIESDDWGSIRIPSAGIKNDLIDKGYKLNNNYFTRYDSLESADDLITLLNVLINIKDKLGNHPVFTTLNILGNPDFEAIKLSDFTEYIFQPVGNTYAEYGNDAELMQSLWISGMNQKLVFPAYHGREHVNVPRWLRALKNPELKATREFFNHRISGIHPWMAKEKRGEFQAAFDPDEPNDILLYKGIMSDGLNHFEKYFGYRSNYFVPPNGCLPICSQEDLQNIGISYLNTVKWGVHKDSQLKGKRQLRYLGMKSKSGIRFITRNVFFEPSNRSHQDWVSKALKEIAFAFQFGKPAIICTHRVNYVSRIDTVNRDRNLKLLWVLLKEITIKWPDVEFISTPELGRLISEGD